MKRAAASNLENGKQSRLTSFFVIPQKRKDPEPSISLEETEVEVGTEDPNLHSPSLSQPYSGKRRKFQTAWLKDLLWLTFNERTGIAQCEVCAAFPGIADVSSKVVKGFVGPFKLETFKKHEKSYQHQKCMVAQNAELHPETTPIAVCVKKMDQKMFEHMKSVFNIAYFIAKNNKPFSDLEGQLLLAEKLGIEVRKEYNNDKRCKEFVSYIAAGIRNELICELKDQNFVSLLLDGSTDKGGVEELILYARYLKDKGIKEVFLSIIPLESATADGYTKAIYSELERLELSEWLSSNHLIGIGTDGAASMIAENGVVQKIRQKLSHVVGVHCIAHRLNLSVLSAVKNVKFIDEIDTVLKKLYKFYRSSPKRMRQLKQVSVILQGQLLKFQFLYKVRWVASKVGALAALVKDWKCVVVHLENISTEKGDASAVAKGLLKKLKDFRFVHMLHFLLDYLTIFKNLSLIFQRQELFMSAVELHIKSTVTTLTALIDVPGHYENMFVSSTTVKGIYQEVQLHGLNASSSTSFEVDKKNLVQCGAQYLQERLLNNHNIVQHCRVFDTFTWPTGKDLEKFGVDEIRALAQHFKKQLSPDMNSEICINLQNEWYEFKVLGQGMKLSELLNKVLSNSDRFPVLGKLLSIVSVLPVSTVSCERGFSLMNLIKDKFRSSMEAESLNDLMMINFNGPSLSEFDPSKAIDRWYFGAKTARHIHGHNRASGI